MKKHLFTLTLVAFLFAACKDSDCPEPTTPAKDPSTWTFTKWEIQNGAFYIDDVLQYNFTANSDTITRDELSLRENGTYIFDIEYKGDYIVQGTDPQRLTGNLLEVGTYQKVSSGSTGTITFNSSASSTWSLNILSETSTQLVLGSFSDESFDNGDGIYRQTGEIKYTFQK